MVVRFAHMVVLFHEGRVWRKAPQPLYIRPSTGASAREGRGINNLEIKIAVTATGTLLLMWCERFFLVGPVLITTDWRVFVQS